MHAARKLTLTNDAATPTQSMGGSASHKGMLLMQNQPNVSWKTARNNRKKKTGTLPKHVIAALSKAATNLTMKLNTEMQHKPMHEAMARIAAKYELQAVRSCTKG